MSHAILSALASLKPAGTGKPQAIIADTIKGRGVKKMELSLQWHVANLAGGMLRWRSDVHPVEGAGA